MASVFDVAKYILSKRTSCSTWKLQKLCYYAQAWTLAWDDRPLFPEEFEAWVNGPVCRELFHSHRGAYTISYDALAQGNEDNLTLDDVQNIDIVLGTYGDKEPYWLREQTHSEDPWKLARVGCTDDEPCANIITKDSMALYYGGL